MNRRHFATALIAALGTVALPTPEANARRGALQDARRRQPSLPVVRDHRVNPDKRDHRGGPARQGVGVTPDNSRIRGGNCLGNMCW